MTGSANSQMQTVAQREGSSPSPAPHALKLWPSVLGVVPSVPLPWDTLQLRSMVQMHVLQLEVPNGCGSVLPQALGLLVGIWTPGA